MLRSWSGLVVVGAVISMAPMAYAGESDPGAGNGHQSLSNCDRDFLSRLDEVVVGEFNKKWDRIWSDQEIRDEEDQYAFWLESAQATADELVPLSTSEIDKMHVLFEQWQKLPKILLHPIYSQIMIEQLNKSGIQTHEQFKALQSQFQNLDQNEKFQLAENIVDQFSKEIQAILGKKIKDIALAAEQAKKMGIDPKVAPAFQAAIESGKSILIALTLHRLENVPVDRFFKSVDKVELVKVESELQTGLEKIAQSNSSAGYPESVLERLETYAEGLQSFDERIEKRLEIIENARNELSEKYSKLLNMAVLSGFFISMGFFVDSSFLRNFGSMGLISLSPVAVTALPLVYFFDRKKAVDYLNENLNKMNLPQLDRVSKFIPAAKSKAKFLRKEMLKRGALDDR